MKHFKAYAFKRRLPSPVGPHSLESALSESRRERFRQVLARRITTLTVVVENCWDPHNATAVLRTCDAFGLHRLHVITGSSSFKINRRISQGAHRYMDVGVHKDTAEAYSHLHSHGFRILASDLGTDSVVDPHNLKSLSEPLALVFGNEEAGVSEEAREHADGSFFIPMCGFTQSLNLSVTVAVTLFSLRHQALTDDLPGDMHGEEQAYWYDLWVRRQSRVQEDDDIEIYDARGERDQPRKD